jgi:hypothetical protein
MRGGAVVHLADEIRSNFYAALHFRLVLTALMLLAAATLYLTAVLAWLEYSDG